MDVKLAVMKSIHLVITDLFLPEGFAAGVSVPALEKLLARGRSETLAAVPLEKRLCGMFGVPCRNDVPVAPIAAAFDGLDAGCWLRADPVHLRLQREQLVLLPNLAIDAHEAAGLCASLNEHFAGQGMEFAAPHPDRWYVRLDRVPDIATIPLSQVAGRNVHGLLPEGGEKTRWHQVFNEIQMLLFAHPLNEAREARGDLPVNSVWLWGGGTTPESLSKLYDDVRSDEVLVEMFAAAAGIPFAGWTEQWHAGEGRQLLVWTGLRSALQRGDLEAWRDALQDFETGYAQPILRALRAGQIEQLDIDILGAEGIRRVRLTRGDAWAFWRRSRRLAQYSIV